MHVLEHEKAQQQDLQRLGSDLTGKFVRTWRSKERDGKEQWLRRSRLVAREFNRMEVHDDLFSPASNHVVERLLPALAVSQAFKDTFFLGPLDIGDAYLHVPQANRRHVRIMDYPSEFQLLICRCLPGQRDGSRQWFDFFTDFLVKELHLEQCALQPAMLRITACDGGGVLLVHVDGVLFLADERHVQSKMIPALKSCFKVSLAVAPRLRHISGRLLWMQRQVRDNVFKIVQVGTTRNPTDTGTKLLTRDRHFMILFMLGFVCEGERVGEEQFRKQKQMESSRRSIKVIKGMYGSSAILQVAEGAAMLSSYSSIFGKAHSSGVNLECSWGLGSGHG